MASAPSPLATLRAQLDTLGRAEDLTSDAGRDALMQTASDAMRSALLDGDHGMARAMAGEVMRRCDAPKRLSAYIRATSPASWRATERIERLRPYVPAVLALEGPSRQLGTSRHEARLRADIVFENLATRMPESTLFATSMYRILEKVADDLWGTAQLSRYHATDAAAPDAPAVFRRPVVSLGAFRRAVHLALRERRAVEYGKLDTLIGEPRDLQLVAASPEAFVAVSRFLRERPGFVGVFATREWSPLSGSDGVRRHRRLRACVRAALVVDEVPFTVELTLPVGETGARSDAPQIARVVAALDPAGGGDLEVAGVQLSSRAGTALGLYTHESCPPETQANLAVDHTVRLRADDWLGPERCAHPHGVWKSTSGEEVWQLTCPSCHRVAVASVPLHQLPEHVFRSARTRLKDEQAYLDLERFRAVMEGRDPLSVPDSIDALRSQDGVRTLSPTAYAIGGASSRTTPRGDAEAVLAGAARRRR